MRGLLSLAAVAAGLSISAGTMVRAAVPSTVQVPGLVRSIEAGEIITGNDLALVEAPLYAAHLAPVPADLIGKEAKHHLEAGKPIHNYDVGPPQLVKKGQKVFLVVKKGPMIISAVGKALTAGGAGDTVRVQNAESFALLEGEVTGAGTVQIELISR